MYQKVLTTVSQVFTPENMRKINQILENRDKILKGIDRVEESINNLSKRVKDNTDALCEVYNMEKLDIENLKKIIVETRMEDSAFVAVLNLGRNKRDELEVFLQYLDADKNAIVKDKVYCIRCEMISKDLKENFGDKELLLVNV